MPSSSRFLSVAAILAAVVALPAAALAQQPLICGTGVHAGEDEGFVGFPSGDIFCPLLADPKGEGSFMTLARGDFPTLTERDTDTDLGSVGISDVFALARWNGERVGDGLQVGLAGSVFAQFDLGSASFDLINADYLIGIPVTVRAGDSSARLRIYHQSSHLGDEYLLREVRPERENLSFESLEVLLSQRFRGLRAYAGGEYIFNREPETLEPLLAHGGVELRVGQLSGGPRFVMAVDMKSSEQQDWDAAWSARAGVEFALWREPGHPPRLWSLLVEFYDGPSPYGQFFQEQIEYVGVGLHFSR